MVHDYRGVYDSHLKCLQDFDEATKEFGVLKGICAKIYEDGWWVCSQHLHSATDGLASIHSGVPALSMQPQNVVLAQIIASAIKEHQEGSTTEDESEWYKVASCVLSRFGAKWIPLDCTV